MRVTVGKNEESMLNFESSKKSSSPTGSFVFEQNSVLDNSNVDRTLAAWVKTMNPNH